MDDHFQSPVRDQSGRRRFHTRTTLPGRIASPGNPQIAVDPGGDATLVYEGEGGLRVLVRHPAGSWHALPALTGASRLLTSEAQVARDSHGETILAWVRGSGTEGEPAQVQAVVLGANGKPRYPLQTLLSARNLNIGELRLAVNERGDAVLAWHQKAKGGPVAIEAAARSAGARFGRPLTVSRRRDADEVSVALDARGLAAILFTHIISTQPGVSEPSEGSTPAHTQTAHVEVSTRPPGAHWSKPDVLAPHAEGSTFEPLITGGSAGGELMAIWTDARFRGYDGRIEAAAVGAAASRRAPAALSATDSFAPTLAVTANGDATAAWVSASESSNTQSNTQSSTESIETADYKP